MEEENKLAIVIPAYRSIYFRETLEALASQTVKNFVCYIGDDASPDNIGSLVEEFKHKFQIRYIRFSENFGAASLVSQWKRCVDLSTEEWIWLLCDDDVPATNCVEDFLKNLPNLRVNNSALFRFATVLIGDLSTEADMVYTHPRLETGTDFIKRKLEGKTRSSLSEYIFSRAAYKRSSFEEMPLAWHSDDIAWLSFSQGANIFSSNDATVSIRLSRESISGNTNVYKTKFQASLQFIDWLMATKSINQSQLGLSFWLTAYLNVEGYFVNRLVPLTSDNFFKLWKLRIRCVGFVKSLKILKLFPLLFQKR